MSTLTLNRTAGGVEGHLVSSAGAGRADAPAPPPQLQRGRHIDSRGREEEEPDAEQPVSMQDAAPEPWTLEFLARSMHVEVDELLHVVAKLFADLVVAAFGLTEPRVFQHAAAGSHVYNVKPADR